ncbi:MAG: efflux RND transporter periplasmic adaptor subunit [Bernardetiaceae bacterium]
MKTNPYHFLLWIALIALMAACGGASKQPLTTAEKEAQLTQLRQSVVELQNQIQELEASIRAEKGETAEDNLRRITAIRLETKTFQHFIEVQGNVTSDQNVLVNPEMSGTITRVHVREGDRVSAGQTLATLDDAILRSNIAELESRLSLAQQTFDRQKNLWDQKIGTEMQFLQAKNQVEVLQRNIAVLEEQRAKANVKAPIAGTINEVFVNQGEMANPAMPVARIVSLSQVKVEAEVSERYLPVIRKGDKITLHFPVLNQSQEAMIDFVGDYVDATNRTFKVQARLNNPKGSIKPNMIATLKINDLTQKDAVAIPLNLIQQSADGTKFVWVVAPQEGKQIVERRNIRPGIAYEGMVLIEEGLGGNETLVEKGYSEVVAGEEVVIIPSEPTVAMD